MAFTGRGSSQHQSVAAEVLRKEKISGSRASRVLTSYYAVFVLPL
jgi:hypothetical protein